MVGFSSAVEKSVASDLMLERDPVLRAINKTPGWRVVDAVNFLNNNFGEYAVAKLAVELPLEEIPLTLALLSGRIGISSDDLLRQILLTRMEEC